MAHSDTVADLLTRIRNAKTAEHKYVDVRFTKLNKSIIEVLQSKGYVRNFLVNEKAYKMRIFLKYVRGSKRSVIQGLKRMSRPGLRRYIGCDQIPRVFSGLGISILSTPQGVVDGKKARELKVGGELLCLVW